VLISQILRPLPPSGQSPALCRALPEFTAGRRGGGSEEVHPEASVQQLLETGIGESVANGTMPLHIDDLLRYRCPSVRRIST